MLTNFFITLTLFLSLSMPVYSTRSATIHEDDEGLLDTFISVLGQAAEEAKELFKAGSKKFLGKRRHDTIAEYITFLSDKAKQTGQSVSQFVQSNWEEIKKSLSKEEAEELSEQLKHSEL